MCSVRLAIAPGFPLARTLDNGRLVVTGLTRESQKPMLQALIFATDDCNEHFAWRGVDDAVDTRSHQNVFIGRRIRRADFRSASMKNWLQVRSCIQLVSAGAQLDRLVNRCVIPAALEWDRHSSDRLGVPTRCRMKRAGREAPERWRSKRRCPRAAAFA